MAAFIEQHSETVFTVTLVATNDTIRTTVTSSGAAAADWIADILHIADWVNVPRLVVGLDAEWRPSYGSHQNPIAVLQLCVGRRCLVFQILRSNFIPESLTDFLADSRFTFVGVGIDGDADRLLDELGLRVANREDLRELAAVRMGRRELRDRGLAALAREVMAVEIRKPRRVTMSNWDNEELTLEQIQYACLDAFLSFEIGRRLLD